MDKVLASLQTLDLDSDEGVKQLQLRIEIANMLLEYEIRKVFDQRGLGEKFDEIVRDFKPLDADDVTPEDGVLAHNE